MIKISLFELHLIADMLGQKKMRTSIMDEGWINAFAEQILNREGGWRASSSSVGPRAWGS